MGFAAAGDTDIDHILDIVEIISSGLYNAGSYLPVERVDAPSSSTVQLTATETAFAMLVPETTSPVATKRKAYVAVV